MCHHLWPVLKRCAKAPAWHGEGQAWRVSQVYSHDKSLVASVRRTCHHILGTISTERPIQLLPFGARACGGHLFNRMPRKVTDRTDRARRSRSTSQAQVTFRG